MMTNPNLVINEHGWPADDKPGWDFLSRLYKGDAPAGQVNPLDEYQLESLAQCGKDVQFCIQSLRNQRRAPG